MVYILKLNDDEIVIGAVYQSSLKEKDLNKLVVLSTIKKCISGGDLNTKTTGCSSRVTRLRENILARHADINENVISAPGSPMLFKSDERASRCD